LPPPSQAVSEARRDTAVVVRKNDLELFVHLKPVPLRAGEHIILLYGVRNAGTLPREITVAPCVVRTRGFKVLDSLVCATSSIDMTLEPGKSWELQTPVTFEGPPGHRLFEIRVLLVPDAWVGLELDLSS
jgi:hypothetical protein